MNLHKAALLACVFISPLPPIVVNQIYTITRFENLEGAPYAYNAGGVKAVQARAQAKTNSATLDAVGGGKLFPLYYLDLADNGNYMETNEVAKRATPCGDPRLVRESAAARSG